MTRSMSWYGNYAVPCSLDNLCPHEIIRSYAIDRLGLEANAAAHVVPNAAWTPAPAATGLLD